MLGYVGCLTFTGGLAPDDSDCAVVPSLIKKVFFPKKGLELCKTMEIDNMQSYLLVLEVVRNYVDLWCRLGCFHIY